MRWRTTTTVLLLLFVAGSEAATPELVRSKFGKHLYRPLTSVQNVAAALETFRCAEPEIADEDLRVLYRKHNNTEETVSGLGYPPFVLRRVTCVTREGLRIETESEVGGSDIYSISVWGGRWGKTPPPHVAALVFMQTAKAIDQSAFDSFLRWGRSYGDKAQRQAHGLLREEWNPMQTAKYGGLRLTIMPRVDNSYAVWLRSERGADTPEMTALSDAAPAADQGRAHASPPVGNTIAAEPAPQLARVDAMRPPNNASGAPPPQASLISSKNWMAHPEIKAVRAIYKEVKELEEQDAVGVARRRFGGAGQAQTRNDCCSGTKRGGYESTWLSRERAPPADGSSTTICLGACGLRTAEWTLRMAKWRSDVSISMPLGHGSMRNPSRPIGESRKQPCLTRCSLLRIPAAKFYKMSVCRQFPCARCGCTSSSSPTRTCRRRPTRQGGC